LIQLKKGLYPQLLVLLLENKINLIISKKQGCFINGFLTVLMPSYNKHTEIYIISIQKVLFVLKTMVQNPKLIKD